KRARCWVKDGEEFLEDAVDALQNAAEAYGLVAELGPDRVQEIMAAAFKDQGINKIDDAPTPTNGFYKPRNAARAAEVERQLAEAKLFDPWERYIVPEFPLQVLPLAVRAYVTSQATVIGCDRSALAMAALTAISGALDHGFAVKMMRNGNWWEHP